MALHDRDGYANGAENLYKCVKCDAINELDMIMRVVERKQSKTTAA
jgi:hypothetical protein